METYKVNSINPHARYMNKTADILKSGGLVVYPTDVNYGLGCLLSSSAGVKNLNALTNKLGRNKLHTIICRDYRDVSKYASIPNNVFRAMKKIMPGPYTMILEATPLVPKVCQTSRSTIGIRMFESTIISSLLELIQGPLLNFTAIPSSDENIIDDPDKIEKLYANTVDVFLNVGEIPSRYTTVIDFTSSPPMLVREGEGKIKLFSL